MSFGGWSIEPECFSYILKNLSNDSVIFEIGSGHATEMLCKHYKVFSLEESKDWIDVYQSNYIYAPLVDGWYSVATKQDEIPKKYDLLLVDGPAYGERKKLIENLENINFFTSGCKKIIFDDVERKEDYEAYCELIRMFSDSIKTTEVIKNTKHFGYIELL